MTQWVHHLATSLLKSSNDKIFSWSRFQRLSCPLAFFYIHGLVHALFQSNNDRVAYIESFSRLSVWHTTNYHSSRLPSFYIWQFSTCHVEIQFRKFKVLPVLHVQISIWKPRQTWVLQRYRWTYKTLFRSSLINRPIQNYRYQKRILPYVIQLSDRVYNVTFPA
jgi:hypothetical protein